MNAHLQTIQDFLLQSEIGNADKETLAKAIKDVNRQLAIIEFKLDRTEKVKRTTAILLEETIEELEQKRKVVEEAHEALKKSMDELKTTQTQLIHAEKMASLGELTAGIAHEIQNPLNFVKNFSEVNAELIEELKEELEKGNLEEVKAIANDIADNEAKISHHGKRADAIVKGMLQHSRTDSGQKEPTDLNALADEYLRLAYHGLRAKDKSFNAGFKTELDGSLPKINVIPQDIGRVLLNLFNNAFYACTEKIHESSPSSLGKEATHRASAYKPTVSVQTRHTLSLPTSYEPLVTLITKNLGNKIEISVQDNGPGIPDEIKDKIFQPFFTTKPTGEGTGLGLSMSYDTITKGHGGQLHVETEPGKGSEFIINIPLTK